ncbi:MAG: hypothetical protein ACK459_05200 [Akkermansiaceae bacterium]|jgi:hypothetical protein
MPKGEHLKGKKNGIPFTKDNQPEKNGRKPKPSFADILDDISANDGAMEFDKFTILTKTDKSGKEIDVVRINLPSDMAMAIGLWNKASKDPKWFDLLLKVKRDMLLPKQIEQKTTILGLDSEFVD